MTVNDIQSGMGIYSNNRDYNTSESISNNNSEIQERKIEYTTKAETRKKECKDKAQQPLNSLCNCGSNKKYKNCCIKKIL